ncbi:Gfo/Idh/MocA family oxidoreductase [Paludicola sp. MB14-C6]|uniref:Gfo/Idh/MocA family protein n=1 Tax=Paludihabitans sp. MB14-C6 TaxID=3070656 RepID=UPI0027DD6F52|nr:Gfo/Idh/MocA family oxidoreductase [Paludicola sp. MB14-C6]WMJ24272.1 Gfo/Idh/MocA family oxidoreductase [Paludicola sp. MB14-C6]
MKYALIGTGRISVNHIASAMKHSDELEFVAVCDIVPENMDNALAKAEYHKPILKYTDYKQMVQECKPDLVAIATESGIHAEIGVYCLNNGCNLIIEKPIAMSIDDAQLLIDTAKANNKILCACHQNRFNKSIQKIRAALEAGRFGRLSHIAAHVRWNRNESYYTQAPWRGKWASDGGCLMNQCIHNADLMCWMLGDIEEVFAYTNNTQHPYIEGEDLGIALVKSKNGAYGLFEGTVNVFPKNLEETLYIFGETGTVKAAGTSVNLIEEWNFSQMTQEDSTVKEECHEAPPNVYGFGHEHVYADVIEAIHTGRKPLIDGEQGKKALELILAIYKSKKTGLPVKLPLDHFASTEMAGTFHSATND